MRSLTSSWVSPAAELNKSSVSMITKQKIQDTNAACKAVQFSAAGIFLF
jgi:hypothetical protein